MLTWILLATFAISLVSFVGILFSYSHIKKFLHYFISFAAAVLISVALLDLIPHSLLELSRQMHLHEAMVFVLIGVILFFLIERFIHWHHCDKDHCSEKPAGMLIFAGDFVHNFVDGLIIAGAFMLDINSGILTSITVAIHEIPQEFGDFAVLIHSGYTKKKALLLNFISALSAVIGGVVGYFMFDFAESFAPFIVLVAAGGFLYVALTDIVPSLHKHERSVSIIEALIFITTAVLFYFFVGFVHAH